MTMIIPDQLQSCCHCGGCHSGTCPKVKAIEYFPNGGVKRVEYHGTPEPAPYPRLPTYGPTPEVVLPSGCFPLNLNVACKSAVSGTIQ